MIKTLFVWVAPPPPSGKLQKKQFFLLLPFNRGAIKKKNCPPPFRQKNPNKSQFFLLKKTVFFIAPLIDKVSRNRKMAKSLLIDSETVSDAWHKRQGVGGVNTESVQNLFLFLDTFCVQGIFLCF